MKTENKNIEEKILHPANGVVMLVINLIILVAFGFLFAFGIRQAVDKHVVAAVIMIVAACIGMVAVCIAFGGLKTVRPNEALVLTLFGAYYGTIRESGFYFVNPFCESNSPVYDKARSAAIKAAKSKSDDMEVISVPTRKRVSLKSNTLKNEKQKVNDGMGNPIVIGTNVIWRVSNPTKAVFNVEDYAEFISIQTDSTVRNIARLYPYDVVDEDNDESEKTLRGSVQEIADRMEEALQERVNVAGIIIEDVKITNLAYSEEIAAAMLQRQQATAIIAARQKIVDGAVGMVKMAIDKLGDEEIVLLDEERKAAMVSNLLVVLCSGKDTQPIVNSGSIY
ncbi:SPFH domain-containing protein [Frisingicoccus caecimuris]|uniref:SPFH domain/Band 7 family protein n=1 Tax=Frisingicoccus caecimuris TaxID=1796636 RepID=A0A4R2LBU3_9FIRM|nr:SPFH domain-containing protein [Frisingicoccus caecimuris]MCR1919904.1 SPFH domain-containing protein [Frisingicoccus caecimuris]TCO81891.1 SPFH domain/Band 7 family protein [Frisingicoccus caecimuris]